GASVTPPLDTRNTSHTSQFTEPPLFNDTIHIPKDSQNQATLSISTDNRSDAMISTAQLANVASNPEVLTSAGTEEDSYDELQTPLSDDPPLRTGRVRFRSRVRITSGLNRRKKKSRSERDYMTFSSSSSLSGSPSSSISAPLRTQEEEDVGKPGWGTLGQRVSMFVRANGQRAQPREQREGTSLVTKTQSCPNGSHRVVNERTPLTDHLSFRGDGIDHRADNESNLSRDIELVFGPWPNRLLNHHWWWWHLEPIVCCHCLVESDDEG
ncbi:hypothetical protein CVT25_005951, partial [Psilocybe cyanescens]